MRCIYLQPRWRRSGRCGKDYQGTDSVWWGVLRAHPYLQPRRREVISQGNLISCVSPVVCLVKSRMHLAIPAYVAAILFKIADPNLQRLPLGLLESFLKCDINRKTEQGGL